MSRVVAINKGSVTLLGTGGVQGQVKGQRLMGIKAVNDSLGWQHAKIKSTKSNPPAPQAPRSFQP